MFGCVAYFRGDGRGNCDTGCQWYAATDGNCPFRVSRLTQSAGDVAFDSIQRYDSYMLNAHANSAAGDLQRAVSYLEAAVAEITAEIREG